MYINKVKEYIQNELERGAPGQDLEELKVDEKDWTWVQLACKKIRDAYMDKGEPDEEEEVEKEPRVLHQQEAVDPLELAMTFYPVTITGEVDVKFRKNVMWEVCHKARMGNRPSECQGFCSHLNLN